MEKLLLVNRLSPGDIIMMSSAIRDLKLAYPKDYLVGVKSPCNEIFFNNPYVDLSLTDKDKEVKVIDMQYPIIHKSGITGVHFSDGYRLFLQDYLKRVIPKTSMKPEIFLSQDEINWISKLKLKYNYSGRYWIINAGYKNDTPLKQYPFYQEVVNLLKGKIQFVQVGLKVHRHPKLEGVLDMIGETDKLRELFRLSYFADGALCGVSLQMVIMQAFSKPCVVVAGGREGMRWQAVNFHSFLHTVGMLPCCKEDGCWIPQEPGNKDCINKVNGIAKCMSMISPEQVAQAIENFYIGGILPPMKRKE